MADLSTRAAQAADRLRDIESLTDAGLAQLGVTELLDELLDRTLDALSADTVTVLLLELSSGQLVATARTNEQGDFVVSGLRGAADEDGEHAEPGARGEHGDLLDLIHRKQGKNYPLAFGERIVGPDRPPRHQHRPRHGPHKSIQNLLCKCSSSSEQKREDLRNGF